ncbi:SMI1/KNR4 family protein [Solitalea canadensis]|uniref:Knr4/Smi1-like domain-containing protein n=1 Tax=Solitalea canadensis (strain ATCC 29591 / DSM 3403 / JCM 21819 / LMG 8368 / NBRC 15130 / NCIMB 12057 / USAM 9D) TaxID=929556 RepID=H8KWH9_SOLCM|nr:SMI1/KNR4 family protein [Solitalea canadensis]AFD08097.1 hypothetical protein Solca_3081 [Solitalea canadensis DSM 3403]
MNEKINFYLNDIEKNEHRASDELIKTVQDQLDFVQPNDYIDLMKAFDGGEGEIGENSWLCLFPIEELIEINEDYKILMEQIPDYYLFGKDSADTGFAFHKQELTYIHLALGQILIQIQLNSVGTI